MKCVGRVEVAYLSRAEQSAAPDRLQRPLVPRARFRQQVSASVRHLSRETLANDILIREAPYDNHLTSS